MCDRRRLLCATITISLISICAWAGAASAQEPEPRPKYLSTDLVDHLSSIVQGWGALGMNTAVKPLDRPAMKLRIKDKEYERGLGHHANGEIVVDLDGQFQTFQTDIGIQWQGGQNLASVIFRVLVDGKKVFDSGVMREGDAPRSIKIPVTEADELTLVADDAGDGITCDCANWADARLIPDPAAAKRPPAIRVDIGPFGRVATWDPRRMKGTTANRVEEFPAADVRLYREVLPESDGSYRVPISGTTGCIGLRWDENRMLRQVVLAFDDTAEIPPKESIQLQTWSGESAWQGAWESVNAAPEQVDNHLVWNFSVQRSSRGTQKVRWLFADLKKPVVLKGLHAYSRSHWVTVDLRVEATQPAAGRPIKIVLHNGLFGDALPTQEEAYRRIWDTTKPLKLKVRTALTRRYKADRTVLQFSGSDIPFGVAVEDIVANDGVYVPHAGIFLVREPAPVTRVDYLRSIAGKRTLLDQVRKRADQTFAQALATVHNPIQDRGPMMLSLACDNRKFVAERERATIIRHV